VAICSPGKETRGGVLSDRQPTFTLPDRRIAVGEDCGWEKDGRVWWELYDHLEVPQHEVASISGVISSQAGDRTPTPAEVLEVPMWVSARLWTKVEGR